MIRTLETGGGATRTAGGTGGTRLAAQPSRSALFGHGALSECLNACCECAGICSRCADIRLVTGQLLARPGDPDACRRRVTQPGARALELLRRAEPLVTNIRVALPS